MIYIVDNISNYLIYLFIFLTEKIIFWTAVSLSVPNLYVHIFMSPTENILKIAPAIIRSYGISFLLPVFAGGEAIWFAMPLTELIVAIYVVAKMGKYTKQLRAE